MLLANTSCHLRFRCVRCYSFAAAKFISRCTFSCIVFALFAAMDKKESRGMNSSSEDSRKRASMTTEEERPSKAARTRALSDTPCLENVPVPR